MTLVIKKPTEAQLRMRRTWQPMDSNAATYIAAVEAADGQALEEKTKIAIDNFVLGCKADGIWNAMKASCILAGARTLNGALVPLVGTAPSRQGTEGGWNYNRKTGLQGNGTDNWINSSRAINADPSLNQHLSIYLSTFTTSGTWIGSAAGTSNFVFMDSSGLYCSSVVPASIDNGTTGFVGASRGDSASFSVRRGGLTSLITSSTNTKTQSSSIPVFAYRTITNTIINFSPVRLPFYSFGESLDLALLDARVTDLINAIGAAIP